ncbi:glycerol kinase GlpK [Vibrio sp. ZSDZ65]|uniref:Glycerol kinase n=1 Tax=Vibrio qingdaonensis TaxID=2829491 RepID=A0A9X3HV22_9VIBR|nr:glycerol kinase GlpK [Vibrio qingdaonensis]MCW8345080.1 glycerol kinase GlpK [Vibrio qingdaonensis]
MNQHKKVVVALDQGTTSSRAIVFDRDANAVCSAQREFTQIYPQPGWVEHDPMEIWATQRSSLTEVLAQADIANEDVAAIGITNQRETTIVWDKESGQPIYNAIVWQCRRTANFCDQLKQDGHDTIINQRTGLVVDAYFSASKIAWILDNVDGARERAEKGELLFGTVDTWLVWKLTHGKSHVTDVSNASRTMLFNIHTLQWDSTLLDIFNIPKSMLPDVKSSSEIYGYAHIGGGTEHIPISGIAGDQQAALFGQQCFKKGMVKNTYGTGCFLLMNTGGTPMRSKHGLLTTIGYQVGDSVTYALEGSVFMGGATIQWLRDELGLIRDAQDTQYFAEKVSDTNGVYLVPAFVGLGAPYWDPHARGSLTGLTRGTNRNHIIRAALESIAYQSRDVLLAMEEDSGIKLTQIRVDGGAVANDFLMQFQADIMGSKVVRPVVRESTALGAAMLAGLATGFWQSQDELADKKEIERVFRPAIDRQQRDTLYRGWEEAIGRTKS